MSTAFVFPGQGSQSVGMMKAFYDSGQTVKDTFDEASETLGFDLWSLIANGPESDLNRTDNTQPAMLASGVACWRVWNEAGGITAELMAGHSLGEYTALCCAGVLEFTEAIELVTKRGRLMQSAVPEGMGAMAAILGLDDAAVRQVCDNAAEGQVLQAVNYNAPGQIVIAGHTEAIDRALVQATEAGAKRALKLAVSAPSHCDLMESAAESLEGYMQNVHFSSSSVPVLHNISAATSSTASQIRQALIEQLYSPVLWVDTIKAMADSGVTRIIEMGPGRVLTGLNKRIDKSLDSLAVYDPPSLEKALAKVAS